MSAWCPSRIFAFLRSFDLLLQSPTPACLAYRGLSQENKHGSTLPSPTWLTQGVCKTPSLAPRCGPAPMCRRWRVGCCQMDRLGSSWRLKMWFKSRHPAHQGPERNMLWLEPTPLRSLLTTTAKTYHVVAQAMRLCSPHCRPHRASMKQCRRVSYSRSPRSGGLSDYRGVSKSCWLGTGSTVLFMPTMNETHMTHTARAMDCTFAK